MTLDAAILAFDCVGGAHRVHEHGWFNGPTKFFPFIRFSIRVLTVTGVMFPSLARQSRRTEHVLPLEVGRPMACFRPRQTICSKHGRDHPV